MRAVVFAHAGALTLEAKSIPARWSALLLLTVRLDDVDLAEPLQALRDVRPARAGACVGGGQ